MHQNILVSFAIIILTIHISIATYHIQDFTISNATNNGDINITCIFAIGSNASCLVIFANRLSDYEQVVNVYKVDDSTVSSIIATVPDGTYDVSVCDVVGSDIAVATVTIINVPTSTVYFTETPGKA